MNKINLRGIIRDILPSHNINGVQYNKANLIVKREDGNEDVVSLKFKSLSNPYGEDDFAELCGNIRSYSHKDDTGHNKGDVYVFTYFDKPETDDVNAFELSGRICKIDSIRTSASGKKHIHFIVANNLVVQSSNITLNAYLPCIAWGELAEKASTYKVNDSVVLKGSLHSREYVKQLEDGNVEVRVAHELLVNDIEGASVVSEGES